MGINLQTRFDAIVAQAEAAENELGAYGKHFLGQALKSSANLDNDEAWAVSRSLETVWAREIGVERPELPLATGDLLPDSPNVEEGSTSYRYYLIDDQGDAEWAGSGTGSEMPTTSLTAAEMTGVIRTIHGGYTMFRKELRNAGKAGVRLQPRNAAASVRAHHETWDETLAWGKESIGLKGLFNHPLISVISASGGASSSWRLKDIDAIVADVAALINSIPAQTNEIKHATDLLMSPRLFRFCQQTRIDSGGSDGNGSLTILRHLERIFSSTSDPNVAAPQFPVKFREVRYLDASNSRSAGHIDEDALFAYISNDDEVVSKVKGFIARTYPQQERDLKLITPAESELGAVEMAQPLCCVLMTGVFAG